jgi:hypothetical protein
MQRRSTAFAIAAVAYTALAIAFTFPLILHLRSVVPSDLGDPLLSTSLLWWNAHAVPLTERWWNGFAFVPATGMMAFSDHRLGVSLLATPLQWLGASPLTAYNVVFLLTFPLCALGGHVLGYTLTRRHDAAAIVGLAFGFNPFRIAHLSHLELLAAFPMPIALAALHKFLEDRQPKWMVLFGVAIALQGLCATYYLLFFLVLLGLWMFWFVRDSKTLAAIAGTTAAAGVVLAPIAFAYQRIHAFHGFERSLEEVRIYSGDISSLVTASFRSLVWGFSFALSPGPEHELFPGLTIVVLVVVGVVASVRRAAPITSSKPISAILFLASTVCAAVSMSYLAIGRWSLGVGPLRLLVADSFKAASFAVLLFVLGLATLPAVRSAWQRRSVIAFYVVATTLMFACSLGPDPTFFGKTVLYASVYRWLMALPIFGTGVRVPARFAMLGILTLATAAALAFDRFKLTPSARRVIAGVVLFGVMADGWMRPLDLLPPPQMWPMPADYDFGTVVELPLDFASDFQAMYRATLHGRPIANGQSGFSPTSYRALQLTLDDGNPRGLDALIQSKPLLVAVNRRVDATGRFQHIADIAERGKRLGQNGDWTFYGIEPPRRAACEAPDIRIASVMHAGEPIDIQMLTDHNPSTGWMTSGRQQTDDTMEVDVGRQSKLCTLRISLGTAWYAYPRDLDVTTSSDRDMWTRQFKGSPAALLVRGAAENPRDVWMTVPLGGAVARYVRMRLDAPHPTYPWLFAELRVTGN